MDYFEGIFLWVAIGGYAFGFLFFLNGLVFRKDRFQQFGFWFSAAGFVFHTLAIIARWVATGHLASMFQVPVAMAEGPESADKTLSPYFFVKSDHPDLDQLPLKSTAAEVNVAGVIADVKVTQVYKNEGKRPIEAVYVFPASTRAAVYGMKMTIGERVIVAKIQKRKEARAAYEQAKQAGKSASLLEQQRPNVFQMNVANILPGDEIKTELAYTELLTPTDGVYEFVYPTVVGQPPPPP